MNNAHETTGAAGQRRTRRIPMIIIIAAAIGMAFAAGYRLGVARQEKRLLNEFLVNATRLGIIDQNRLRELTDGAGTNTENDAESASGQGGEL